MYDFPPTPPPPGHLLVMDRLASAVYYSTPSVLCVLLLNVVLPERAFRLASAIGSRTSERMRIGLYGILLLLDTLFILSVMLGFSRHCRPRFGAHTLTCQSNELYCAGFQTGSILVMTAILFVDRLTSAFFLKYNIDCSLSWRCMRSSVLGIAYTSVTLDFNAVTVLLVLGLLVRYVRVAPESTHRNRRMVTRVAVAYVGVVSLDRLIMHDTDLSPLSEVAKKAYSVAFASVVIILFSIS